MTFSIYKMVKKSSDNKVSRVLAGDNKLIQAVEEDEKSAQAEINNVEQTLVEGTTQNDEGANCGKTDQP